MNNLKFLDGKMMSIGGKCLYFPSTPIIELPDGSDFMWLASNFSSESRTIPNSVVESVNGFGDLLFYGSGMTQGDGDYGHYIYGNNGENYLYYDLNTQQLNAIKNSSVDTPYTFIFKTYPYSSGTSGIMSTRMNGGGYNYMIRSSGTKIEMHYGSGTTTSIVLTEGNIYCVEMKSTSYVVQDLTSGSTYEGSSTSSRSMGTRMTLNHAGYSGEWVSTRWYAMYGAPKLLDDSEKTMVVNYIENNK